MLRSLVLTILCAIATLAAPAWASELDAVNAAPLSAAATRVAGIGWDVTGGAEGTLVIVVLTVLAVVLIRRFGALE
jgi:hypothetical protein